MTEIAVKAPWELQEQTAQEFLVPFLEDALVLAQALKGEKVDMASMHKPPLARIRDSLDIIEYSWVRRESLKLRGILAAVNKERADGR